MADAIPENCGVSSSSKNDKILVNLKSSKEFSPGLIEELKKLQDVSNVIIIAPVLPVISGNDTEAPFTNVSSLLEYAEKENLTLGNCGLIYEKYLSGLSESEITGMMLALVGIIENSIQTGLTGTEYEDRILHRQSHLIGKAEQKGEILPNSIVNSIIANVSAIMEVKSAMEVFAANPTAGSCGAVGGVIKALADELGSTQEEIIMAYFAAGMVGVYFAEGPGFSAEEHGCQVECGASAGMAAAAIVQLFGGTAKQALEAASMAIQNMIGLICDPIADRVEAPCLGKNVSAAVKRLRLSNYGEIRFLMLLSPLRRLLKLYPA